MGRCIERRVLMPDIVDAGRRAGHACWIELRLFKALGSWVADTARSADPALSRMFAEHSHHHAWHADLWRNRIPKLEHHPPTEVTRPPNDAVVELVDMVTSAAGSVDRLVGVYRVLIPRLIEEYEALLQATSPLTDGPTARVLKLCLADLHNELREGETALASVIDVTATVDDRQTTLDAAAAAAHHLIG